jgi:gas vesicle protein
MWGALIGGGISAVTGLIGAAKAAKAAREAAGIQSAAAEEAAKGYRATAEEVNPYISEAGLLAGQGVSTVANTAADEIQQRAREANLLLDPYTGVGTQAATSLAEFAGPGKAFSASDLEFDPGYQFRLSEGQKALERSAAARGTLQGGGTLKALTRYAQGAASQEYAAAFDRFSRTQQNRFQNLSTLANLGYGAAGRAGTNLTGAASEAGRFRTGAAEYEGNVRISSAERQAQNLIQAQRDAANAQMQAAQARASGVVGSANAWNQGISGFGNAVGGALTLTDLMKSGRGAARTPGLSSNETYWNSLAV